MVVFDFLKSLFGQQPEPVDVYLLLFSASWCGPSKRFIKEIKEGGINNFTLVDTEANEELAAKYNIRSVPTAILMKKSGEIIKKWVGYDDEDPGQTKFVSFIKSGNYNILPYALKSAPKPQASAPQPKPATPAPKPKPYEVKPFTFSSNQHQRYENGNPVMGVQNCMRSVSVEKNTNGCSGYQLKSGDGYIVKAMNLDVNKPQMSPKPMRLVSHSDAKDELRGYMVSAQTPFGWQDFDLSDYGLTIYYSNGKVSKVTLHMFDRNTDIEYRTVAVQNNVPKTEIPSIREIAKGVDFQLNFKNTIIQKVNYNGTQAEVIKQQADVANGKYSTITNKGGKTFIGFQCLAEMKAKGITQDNISILPYASGEMTYNKQSEEYEAATREFNEFGKFVSYYQVTMQKGVFVAFVIMNPPTEPDCYYLAILQDIIQ